MPIPPKDHNDDGWKALLDQILEQVRDLRDNMVRKDEIRAEFKNVNEKFEVIEDREAEQKRREDDFQKEFRDTKNRADSSYYFINNVSQGVKWFMRALIVAGLTLSTSIFVGFFNAKVSSVPPPLPIPTISAHVMSVETRNANGH